MALGLPGVTVGIAGRHRILQALITLLHKSTVLPLHSTSGEIAVQPFEKGSGVRQEGGETGGCRPASRLHGWGGIVARPERGCHFKKGLFILVFLKKMLLGDAESPTGPLLNPEKF